MQERVIKWREMNKGRVVTFDQFDKFREESVRESFEKRKQEQISNLLQKVSPRYHDKVFSDFHVDCPEQSVVKKVAQRFVETFHERSKDGTCLIFSGNPGTGKTFLSLIMYQLLAKAGYLVSYEPSLQFLRILKEANFNSHNAYHSLLDSYKRIPLLIIDEVTEGYGGKDGQLAEWEKQMLFALVDVRYHHKLCTLILSNRHKQGLTNRLGDRTIDRLNEKSIFLTFNWKSYR